jgi:hypothetical protein
MRNDVARSKPPSSRTTGRSGILYPLFFFLTLRFLFSTRCESLRSKTSATEHLYILFYSIKLLSRAATCNRLRRGSLRANIWPQHSPTCPVKADLVVSIPRMISLKYKCLCPLHLPSRSIISHRSTVAWVVHGRLSGFVSLLLSSP